MNKFLVDQPKWDGADYTTWLSYFQGWANNFFAGDVTSGPGMALYLFYAIAAIVVNIAAFWLLLSIVKKVKAGKGLK